MVKIKKDQLYSIEHCIQRYRERYKKELSIDEYHKLNNEVIKWFIKQDNKFKIIDKCNITNDNYSYILEHLLNNDLIYLVFETQRNCITTFLPIESVLKYQNKKLKK
jgi:hypothetical protein